MDKGEPVKNPIVVNSVQEFVARVTEEPRNAKDHLDLNVSTGTLYRGQADSSWYLSPSLYREDLFHQERILISELRRVKPEEFEGLSEFDILVKMQHYGLPTRLLDMTHNPLVALYFACETATKRDGSVYAFRNMPVFWQENYAVRLIMRYVFDFSGAKLGLDRFMRAISNDPIISGTWNEESKLRDIIVYNLTKIPVIAVRPTLANLRISRQDGAFLLFGMVLEKKEGNTNLGTKGQLSLNLSPHPGDQTGEHLWHLSTKYLIPADRKLEFLNALEILGISRSRLFPELQYQAEFVKGLVVREAKSQRLNKEI